jgi:hypothetical protein
MRCEEFADVTAELALGVLTGRQRAEAIAHLDECAACREDVGQLTVIGEELLALLLAGEPPPGFEARVLARLGHAGPSPAGTASADWRKAGRTRRMLTATAVSVAIAGAGLGGWGLTAAARPPAPAALSSAVLVNASRHSVGRIFLHGAGQQWVYMDVDIGHANGMVSCQLTGADGRTVTVGSFWLADGFGFWGMSIPAGHGRLTGARLVGADGRVLATATWRLLSVVTA